MDEGTITIGSDVYIDNLDASIIYTGSVEGDTGVSFPTMSYIDTQNKSLPYVCLSNLTLPENTTDTGCDWYNNILASCDIASEEFYVICNGTIIIKTGEVNMLYLFNISDKTIKFVPMNDTTEFSVYLHYNTKLFNSGCKLVFDNPSYISDLKVNGSDEDPSNEISLDNVGDMSFNYNENSSGS